MGSRSEGRKAGSARAGAAEAVRAGPGAGTAAGAGRGAPGGAGQGARAGAAAEPRELGRGLTEPSLTVLPLTPERWPDLEAVFGAKGCSVARGCWCMFYRISGHIPKEAGETASQASKRGLRALVDAGHPPGLVGYQDGTPVGWVSLGPRPEFERLKRSPIRRAVDDVPVWSIVCFVVPSAYRNRGVAQALLEGAIAYARAQGAKVLEAYPIDLAEEPNAGSLWFGTASMFARAGFTEVARRKAARPIVRLPLTGA